MRLSSSLALLSLTVCLPPALAQAPPAAPLRETVEVRVTNVDFVVSDSRGNRVTGLTGDDFQLLENGTPKEITNFSEIGGAAAADAPARQQQRILFYFDDQTLTRNNRSAIVAEMKSFLNRAFHPGDQAMIATADSSLKVRLRWTGDPAAIQKALDAIAREMPAGNRRETLRRQTETQIAIALRGDQTASESAMGSGALSGGTPAPAATYQVLLSSVRSYAEEEAQNTRIALNLLEGATRMLSAAGGRKVMILSSEALPLEPGREMFDYLDRLRQRNDTSGGNPQFSREDRTGASAMTESGKNNVLPLVQKIADLASGAAITVYAVNPKSSAGGDSGGVELSNPAGGDPANLGKMGQEIQGLQLLSSTTGGLAMIGARPAAAFAEIEKDLATGYSAGYRTSSEPSVRKLEIRSKNPQYRVRVRKSVAIRPVAEEVADRVLANHGMTPESNDLKVSLQAGQVTLDPQGRRIVPLRVIIPVENLTLIPDAEKMLTGGFVVFISPGSSSGEGSLVDRQKHDIRWPPEVLPNLKGRSMTYAVDVALEKGRDQISIGVLDMKSGATGYEKIVVP